MPPPGIGGDGKRTPDAKKPGHGQVPLHPTITSAPSGPPRLPHHKLRHLGQILPHQRPQGPHCTVGRASARQAPHCGSGFSPTSPPPLWVGLQPDKDAEGRQSPPGRTKVRPTTRRALSIAAPTAPAQPTTRHPSRGEATSILTPGGRDVAQCPSPVNNGTWSDGRRAFPIRSKTCCRQNGQTF